MTSRLWSAALSQTDHVPLDEVRDLIALGAWTERPLVEDVRLARGGQSASRPSVTVEQLVTLFDCLRQDDKRFEPYAITHGTHCAERRAAGLPASSNTAKVTTAAVIPVAWRPSAIAPGSCARWMCSWPR